MASCARRHDIAMRLKRDRLELHGNFMMKTAQLSDMSSYTKANMAHPVPATTGHELETPGYYKNL